MPYKQSNWRTDITIGPYHLGIADKWTGGGVKGSSKPFPRAGGTVQLGGVTERDEGTAEYLYEEVLHAMFKEIEKGVNILKAVITRTPCGDDGTPFAGGGRTFTALLVGCDLPDDDQSSDNPGMASFMFGVDTAAA